MDNTNVKPEENVAAEEEMFDMNAAAAEEEEMFDMNAANAADQMMQKAKEDELDQFKELEGFASIFPENWSIEPPKVDANFFRAYIKKKNAAVAKR